MDEMKIKISTKMMRNIIGKLASKVIAKQIGIKPDIQLNELMIEKRGEKIHLHLNIDADMNEMELLKITRLAQLEDLE